MKLFSSETLSRRGKNLRCLGNLKNSRILLREKKKRRLDNILKNRQHLEENEEDSMSHVDECLEENAFVGENLQHFLEEQSSSDAETES